MSADAYQRLPLLEVVLRGAPIGDYNWTEITYNGEVEEAPLARAVYDRTYVRWCKGGKAYNPRWEKAVRTVARCIHARRLRKFVRLCKSPEFQRTFYGEGGMGRRWDTKDIKEWAEPIERRMAERAQRVLARRFRMRRFLRLCRSEAFTRLFYGEGGMGRRWDTKDKNKRAEPIDS